MEKRYNNQEIEPLLQKNWEKQGIYAPKNNVGPLFSIDTPPPTVSGSLHIGHIFSYTQTDIIARYERMNGKSVFYPFGFDDNGLPTERFVEKKTKQRPHQVGRAKFTKLCLEQTHKAEQDFKQLWQQMGLSVNWNYCYSTISDSVRALSQASFIDLYNKGFVYRKNDPALYCTTCRTTVAQAELDDIELPSFFNDIIFKDANNNDLVVGTTRPELLPACAVLLYHPNDDRYKHLQGTTAKVPLFDFEVPIMADEAVSIEKGTGLVMCCPFGDKTDIEWFKKLQLPYRQTIGKHGKLVENTGILAGLSVKDARAKIIEELKANNLLTNKKEIYHSVNVHERCQTPIEYLMVSQWFINILDHKQTFLDLADKIEWYPTFMKSRYIDWVSNLSWDWGISRQRFFGIPFPVWHCADCNHIIVADTTKLPIDPFDSKPEQCSQCESKNIIPENDVMDTWNTSSLSPYIAQQLFEKSSYNVITDKQSSFIPMSMRPQAHDIIRTWAFYTIIKSWMHHKTIPWKKIVISGHVISGNSEKLSKSKNNAAHTPQQLLKQYPADAIRYWTASGNLGHDVVFSEEQIKIGRKLITKLWNAFRFTQEHIADAPQQVSTNIDVVNQWLLHHTSKAFDEYQRYFAKQEIGLALNVIEQFFWQIFCDTYLELIKHQLFNPNDYDTTIVASTKWTLHHVGLSILQLYAPYVPHVTDAIYQEVFARNTSSLHNTKFSKIQQSFTFDNSLAPMKIINSIVSSMRKLKSDHKLSLKTPLSTLKITINNLQMIQILQQHQQLIKGVAQAQEIIITQNNNLVQNNSQLKEIEGTWRMKIELAI
jgi:valyl-tRNA synthetase